MKQTEIFAERVNFGRFVHVSMSVRDAFGKLSVARPVVFEVAEDDHLAMDPMLRLTPGQAQKLMDELWTIGFRPTQGQQSEGQMGATTRHLNDMRAMVAGLAKVQLP